MITRACHRRVGLFLIFTAFCIRSAQGGIVYPQAAVGPAGEQVFEIELRLANRHPNQAWSGSVRLLRNQDLAGMESVRFEDQNGNVVLGAEGRLDVEIPANEALRLTISATSLQVGPMLIDSTQSDLTDLVPSFFYRLKDGSTDRVIDLIAIQPALTPGTRFHTQIAQNDGLSVGLALVADKDLPEAGGGPAAESSPTQISLTVTLPDGTQVLGETMLGGSEARQRAFFPPEVLDGLPADFASATLSIDASDPIYPAVLAVGAPPQYETIQIGASAAIDETNGAFAPTQPVVYPQAALGPAGDDSFQIELRVGNQSTIASWDGVVRLLGAQDLEGMAGVRFVDSQGRVQTPSDGRLPLTLNPGESKFYRVTSDTLQVGVMAIESETSDMSQLVPSFFYRLADNGSGKVGDLIGILPGSRPTLSYSTAVARLANFNVGVALVSEDDLGAQTTTGPVQVSMQVTSDEGETFSGTTTLGGDQPEQKAFFPNEIVNDLPSGLDVARLDLVATEPIYGTVLGVGSPAEFESVQIGAAPAVSTDARLAVREGWIPVPGGEFLARDGNWDCANAFPRDSTQQRMGGFTTLSQQGFSGATNVSGPRLEVNGDFSVLASLYSGEGQDGTLSLFGALATGPEFWRGLKRLDLVLSGGAVTLGQWNDDPNPQFQFIGGAFQGRVDLEVARMGGEFIVYGNGEELGRVADVGIFDQGEVIFGTVVPEGNQLTVFGLAAAVPSGSPDNAGVVYPTAGLTTPVTQTGNSLRALASSRNLLIGSQFEPHVLLEDATYREVLGREFNATTPGWPAFYFNGVHPAKDRFNFCNADFSIAFAEANDMKVRGHTLVWGMLIPDWLLNGNFSREELIMILRNHIHTVVGRYKGRIWAWDVVNEPVEADGTLKENFWLRGIGPDYIDMAFRWAREADPDALLILNEFFAEGLNAKSDGVHSLVEGMVERGVPIDGVGLQGHFFLDPTFYEARPGLEDLTANINRLGALGLKVHFSEVDISVELPASQDDLDRQADFFKDLLDVCVNNASCTAFILWGHTDAHSWIPGHRPGFGAATPFDENQDPKPAYAGLQEALANP